MYVSCCCVCFLKGRNPGPFYYPLEVGREENDFQASVGRPTRLSSHPSFSRVLYAPPVLSSELGEDVLHFGVQKGCSLNGFPFRDDRVK